MQLRADNIDLATGATVNAGSTTATLNAFTPATVINLGGADTANTLGLTDAELDGITAGILRVGDLTSGRIGFSDAITLGGIAQLELTTGADIQDNHFGPDVTVVSLAMTAGTGIGTASSALGTTVSVIEAQTNTGGINISNTGPVFVGGVTGSLSGLRVVTSGDLSFSAGGTITLQDTGGVEIVSGGSASGNVLLSATGAGADVTATVNKDAITASAGSITVAAGRDILLGTVGTNSDNDVRANGSVTLSAGRDLVVDGAANVISDAFGNNTGGEVIATVGDDIEVTFVHGTDAFIAASGSAGADVTLTTGANGALVLSSGPLAVFSNSGDVTVNADRVVIFPTSGISAPGPGQSVTIQPVSTPWAINLGSTTDGAPTALELADVELDRILRPDHTDRQHVQSRRHHRQQPDHARGRPHHAVAAHRRRHRRRHGRGADGHHRRQPGAADRCWQLGHPGRRGLQSCVQQLRDGEHLHQRCRQLDARRRRWAGVVIERRQGRGGIHGAGPLTVAANVTASGFPQPACR